jgi:hypothetical protein
MLSKLGFGSVILAFSFGIACTSSKDNAAADGGSGGSDVGTGGSNGTGASAGGHAGSGGSAGHNGTGGNGTGGKGTGGNGTGGATTDSGAGGHDSGAGGVSTGGSGTTDSGSTGGSSATDSGSTGNNVLTNPGFEDGVMSPWTSNSSNFIVGSDAPRSGSYNAKLYSGFGDPTWDETMVEEALFLAEGRYTFHIWVEKAGTGTLTTLRLEASSSGSTKTLDILQDVTGTYQEFTVSGITVTSSNGPNLGVCTVRVVAAGDDKVSVYLDDASLTKNP